jgi:6,7-dimethyl-8-ribityllumazine synthase
VSDPDRLPGAARERARAEFAGVGRVHRGNLEGRGVSIALVASRFNEGLVEKLVEGAAKELARRGASPQQVDLTWVPGAFELPFMAQRLARTGRYDAILALGVVIRGETPHFDYVCAEAARGLAQVARNENLPVLFGLVTANDAEQAHARCGGRSNKGEDVARSAIELLAALREVR